MVVTQTSREVMEPVRDNDQLKLCRVIANVRQLFDLFTIIQITSLNVCLTSKYWRFLIAQ